MPQDTAALVPDRGPEQASGELRPRTVLLVIAAGVVFGAGDQYLGSMNVPLATAFSLMSAPWLLLPFCFGCTQVRGHSGAVIGLVGTLAALAGYWTMTLSPVEGVPLGQVPHGFVALVHSDARLLVAGGIAGPVYGLLGQRWRTRRWWVSAVLSAGALLIEPVTRVLNLQSGPPMVYLLELAAGALVAAYCMAAVSRSVRPITPSI
jgi:hypothetical protein